MCRLRPGENEVLEAFHAQQFRHGVPDLLGLSRSEPLLQRRGVFAGTTPRQDAGHTQVLLQVGPVDVGAIANDFEMSPFRRIVVPEARIPSQGHTDGSTIHEKATARSVHALTRCYRDTIFPSRLTCWRA